MENPICVDPRLNRASHDRQYQPNCYYQERRVQSPCATSSKSGKDPRRTGVWRPDPNTNWRIPPDTSILERPVLLNARATLLSVRRAYLNNRPTTLNAHPMHLNAHPTMLNVRTTHLNVHPTMLNVRTTRLNVCKTHLNDCSATLSPACVPKQDSSSIFGTSCTG